MNVSLLQPDCQLHEAGDPTVVPFPAMPSGCGIDSSAPKTVLIKKKKILAIKYF